MILRQKTKRKEGIILHPHNHHLLQVKDLVLEKRNQKSLNLPNCMKIIWEISLEEFWREMKTVSLYLTMECTKRNIGLKCSRVRIKGKKDLKKWDKMLKRFESTGIFLRKNQKVNQEIIRQGWLSFESRLSKEQPKIEIDRGIEALHD